MLWISPLVPSDRRCINLEIVQWVVICSLCSQDCLITDSMTISRKEKGIQQWRKLTQKSRQTPRTASVAQPVAVAPLTVPSKGTWFAHVWSSLPAHLPCDSGSLYSLTNSNPQYSPRILIKVESPLRSWGKCSALNYHHDCDHLQPFSATQHCPAVLWCHHDLEVQHHWGAVWWWLHTYDPQRIRPRAWCMQKNVAAALRYTPLKVTVGFSTHA